MKAKTKKEIEDYVESMSKGIVDQYRLDVSQESNRVFEYSEKNLQRYIKRFAKSIINLVEQNTGTKLQ